MRAERPRRSTTWTILELVAGLVLLGLLIASVEAGRLLDAVRRAHLGAASLGGVLFFAMVAIDAWRMKIAFGRYQLSYPRCVEIQAAGFLLSSVTPGMAGADILRVGFAHRIKAGLSAPIALVLLLRTLGMGVQLATTALWTITFPQRLAQIAHRLSLGERLAAVSLGAVVLLAAVGSILVALVLTSARLRRLALVAWQAIVELHARRLAALLGATVAMVVVGALSLFFFARSLAIAVSLPDMFVVLTLLTLGSLIPLGPGGLGLREGAISGGLIAFGAPPADALAVALFQRASFWAVSLLGGVVLLRWRRSGPG